MTDTELSRIERRLQRPAEAAVYTPEELDGLPEPVCRYLSAAIAPGTPLAVSATLRMRGRIKLGRWLPFRARQVLSPHHGFLWRARTLGIVGGFDSYADGKGLADWKLLGRFTVMHAEGPDTDRSAAGRSGAEAVWLPTTLLPRFGVRWSADADDHVVARYEIDGTPIEARYRIDAHGWPLEVLFDRWGDPEGTGTAGWHPFGGEFTAMRTFDGLTIPSEGRLGWGYGTDRWPAGEFFRYRITALRPVR